ncbi:hypothetical protein QEW_4429 [Clostridioides difficile CD160]|nr:hypothetical protein QEW_4429 [Clostridioides difficile CD160]
MNGGSVLEINIIVLNTMFLVLGILFGILIENKKKEKELVKSIEKKKEKIEIIKDIEYHMHIYKKLNDLEKENKILKERLEND